MVLIFRCPTGPTGSAAPAVAATGLISWSRRGAPAGLAGRRILTLINATPLATQMLADLPLGEAALNRVA